jgi:hypothetical protein
VNKRATLVQHDLSSAYVATHISCDRCLCRLRPADTLFHVCTRLQFLEEALDSAWSVRYKLVPDEQDQIEQAITTQVC